MCGFHKPWAGFRARELGTDVLVSPHPQTEGYHQFTFCTFYDLQYLTNSTPECNLLNFFLFFVLGEHWCITKYIELYVSEWCLKTSEEATIEGLLHTNLAQGPSLPYIRPCMDQLENISYSIIYHFHNQQSFPSLLLGCNTSRTLMQFHFLHVLKQKLCSISHSYIICISLYILRNCIVVFFKESVCNGFRIKEVGYLFCCSTYVRLVNSVLQFSGSSLVY